MLYKKLLLAAAFTAYAVSAADDTGDDVVGLATTDIGDDQIENSDDLDLSSFDVTSSVEGIDASIDASSSGDDPDDIEVSDSLDLADDTEDDDTSLDGDDDGDDDTEDDDTSIDDDDDDDDNEDDADEADDDAQEELCNALETVEDCGEENDDDSGDQLCAYNEATGLCYAIVRRAGINGNGNYDDGFIAAQNAAKQQADQLYTVVGVLGGIIGALMIVIGGGGYYFYQKGKTNASEQDAAELMEPATGQTINIREHDEVPMISQQ